MARGICAVCGKEIQVRRDGRVRQHADRRQSGVTCVGSNERPAERAEVEGR